MLTGFWTSTYLQISHPLSTNMLTGLLTSAYLHEGSTPPPHLNKYVDWFFNFHLSSWGINFATPSEQNMLTGFLTSTYLDKGLTPPPPLNKHVDWFINFHLSSKGINSAPPSEQTCWLVYWLPLLFMRDQLRNPSWTNMLTGLLTSTYLQKGSTPPPPVNKYVDWFINFHLPSNPPPSLNKCVDWSMTFHLSSKGINSACPSWLVY